MTESFSKPRIEGHFTGDRMRAWDTIWGHGVADLVIQNSYVDIKKSTIEHDGSRIRDAGSFLARLIRARTAASRSTPRST